MTPKLPQIKFNFRAITRPRAIHDQEITRQSAASGLFLFSIDFFLGVRKFAQIAVPFGDGAIPARVESISVLKRCPPMDIEKGISKAITRKGHRKSPAPTPIDDSPSLKEKALGFVYFGVRWRDLPRLLGVSSDDFNRLVSADADFQNQLRQCAALAEWRHLVNLNAMAVNDSKAAMFLLERGDKIRD